ncbi:MAG: pectinesterase family protein [Sedimentisphaerales bacterium]|nr:pectinesterase family protein [Sedimentisphaerales bacterium]
MKNLLALVLVNASILAAERTYVVAPDGSGQFRSIQEAIMAVPQEPNAMPWTIVIRPGTYKELVYIQRERGNIILKGDDPNVTTIIFGLHANMPGPDGRPIGTFRTASVFIDADNVEAENLTFENSAGPVGQALAIRLDGDRNVFRKCRFLGWQDTILINRGRHYFKDCYITGHVDFIFGAGVAFFDGCQIHCLRSGYITAASTPKDQAFGFVFSRCRISGEKDVKTYLGRPWRDYAHVVFLDTYMSDVVRPEGWHDWGRPERRSTARFAEFNSTGPGARPDSRVDWARQLNEYQSKAYSIEMVLSGHDGWNPT